MSTTSTHLFYVNIHLSEVMNTRTTNKTFHHNHRPTHDSILKQHIVIQNLVRAIVLGLKAQCAEVSMYAVFPSIPSTLLSTARQGPQTNYSFVRGERVSRMHYHLAPWRGHLCLQRRRRESA